MGRLAVAPPPPTPTGLPFSVSRRSLAYGAIVRTRLPADASLLSALPLRSASSIATGRRASSRTTSAPSRPSRSRPPSRRASCISHASSSARSWPVSRATGCTCSSLGWRPPSPVSSAVPLPQRCAASALTPDSSLVTDPSKLVSRSAEPPARLSRAHLPALLPLLLALRGLALCTSPIRQRCRLSTAKLLD